MAPGVGAPGLRGAVAPDRAERVPDLARVLRSQRPPDVDEEDARAALRARETQPSGGSEVLQTADNLAAYFGGS